MRIMNGHVASVLIAGLSLSVSGTITMAAVKMPAIFGDHMVFQADQPVNVWGKADPGEKVSVKLGQAEAQAVADERGAWRAVLPARKAGAGLTMVVQGENTIAFSDVAVGEVWLASGQSNMQWPVSASKLEEGELAGPANPNIRLFSVGRSTALAPEWNCEGNWRLCTPATVSNFSAVAYFYGRKLQKTLDVPVGLICSAWGGTRIEPWTPHESLKIIPGFEAEIAKLDGMAGDSNQLIKAYREKLARKEEIEAKVQALEDNLETGSRLAQPEMDDSAWPAMRVPEQWEKTALTNFDGLVWLRKAVELPADWAGKDLVLHLGPIDEIDVTWFNGVRIGGKGNFKNRIVEYWDFPRVYKVPGSAVKPGRNVIAAQIIDTAFAGGIWGAKPEEVRLLRADGNDTRSVTLAGEWKYKIGEQFVTMGKSPFNHETPTAIYNAMINPLVGYGIRGAIWYQGESNVSEGELYTFKMRALIEGWRQKWGGGAFPFYYVQLAPFSYAGWNTNAYCLPELWDAQRKALAITNTGMAVITDLGNLRDIHPRRKLQVGERLALWALAKTYGRQGVVCSGPLFASMAPEGAKLRIRFEHAEGGLTGREGNVLSWFEIAGEDGIFTRASATIDGDTVIVESGKVTKPVKVRYGWAAEAEAELTNREGLPASSFQASL